MRFLPHALLSAAALLATSALVTPATTAAADSGVPTAPVAAAPLSAPTGDTGNAPASGPTVNPSQVLGMDVSSHQGEVDWAAWSKRGMRFTYVKATEGSSYRNPYFRSQYTGAAEAGLLRGAYHFANPAGKSGTIQARYFVKHGGRWVKDGRTLPGVLDVEYNPYGEDCYGVTPKQTVTWIRAFVKEYKRLTKRDAVIYTTTDWWQRCTGNSTAFAKTNPLWIARYANAVGALPGGWTRYTFWQYSDDPIDQNRFSASHYRLRMLAWGRKPR